MGINIGDIIVESEDMTCSPTKRSCAGSFVTVITS